MDRSQTDKDDSLSEVDVSAEADKKKTRKPREITNWIEVQRFSSTDDALRHISTLGEYSVWYTNYPKSGKTTYYRCSRVRVREEQCVASLKLQFPSHSEEVILYKTGKPHNCQDICQARAVKRLERTIREEIIRRHNQQIPTRVIWNEYGKHHLENKQQVSNCISNYKRKNNKMTNVQDFITYCEDNSHVPEDEHQPFILDFETDADNSMIRMVLSTRKLLSLNAMGNRVHIDATYNLMIENFPTIVVGTTDKKRSFIPGGIAITSRECEDDFTFVLQAFQNYYAKQAIPYKVE